ncbi:MAG: OmpA family protein [Ignavibacteria bacterium]|nr:OmpA family protein [Ignavibacteria bacterium]
MLIFSQRNINAQDTWTIGGSLKIGYVTQQPTFNQLTGMFLLQDDVNFTGVYGREDFPIVTGQFGYRVTPILSIGLGANYTHTSQIFTKISPTFITVNGRPQEAEIVDSVSTSMSEIGMSPSIELSLFKNFTLRFGGTFHTFLSSSFVQTQDILDTLGGQLSVQIFRERELEDRQSFLSAFMTIGVKLPLTSSKSYFLEPSITYRTDIGSRISGIDWSTNSFSLGLGLVYTPQPSKEIIYDTTIQRDTVIVLGENFNSPQIILHSDTHLQEETIESDQLIRKLSTRKLTYHRMILKPKPLLTANCEVKFVLKDKTESDRIKLTIEESLTNNYVTLLPSLFFSLSSADIPSRYSENSTESSQTALKVYYTILNIIGKRLQEIPNARLSITGCNDGMSETKELSRKRAETVRSYLINKWSIDSSRLLLQVRNLPENPSKTSDEFGLEENRRVDLKSDNEKILEPVLRQDTTRTADPPIVRFRPDVLSEVGVKSWQLDISQQDKVVRVFKANGEPPSILDWDINNEMNVKKLTGSPIQFRFTVVDEDNQTQSVDGVVSFSEKKLKPGVISAEKMSDHFSLMCFNYDETKLTLANRRQLDIIRSSITPQSKVIITGSTDIVGSDLYNQELSERRARAIAKALKATSTFTINGSGKDIFTFPNNLPEGRFYSRRVDIEIEKEVKALPK